MSINVNIKKLHPNARIPEYQTYGSVGFDFHAIVDPDNECYWFQQLCVPAKSRCLVKTGIAMSIPEGYELQLRPRSGLALKKNITITNSPATIDSDWRGEIMVILFNLGDELFYIEEGDRIAQGIISPIVKANFHEVKELDQTERGDNGLGSTGV